MRCLACNVILTDIESTRRYNTSKEFIDLCNKCFHSGVSEQVNYTEREDLGGEENYDEY